jgi:DNA-binding transcriptional LysR family regulator
MPDLVIEPKELFGSAGFPSSSPLLSDRRLRAAEASNPLATTAGLTHEQFLELPYLVYGIGMDRQLNLDAMGIQRRIHATVESFLFAPFLIEGTPLISLVLEREVKAFGSSPNICLFEPPFALPDIHEAMYRHPRHTTDLAHHWLRDRLHQIAIGST